MDGPDYHWQRKRVSYLCVYVEKPRVSLWKIPVGTSLLSSLVFADFPDFCQILLQISHAVNEGNSRVVQEGAPTPSSSFVEDAGNAAPQKGNPLVFISHLGGFRKHGYRPGG